MSDQGLSAPGTSVYSSDSMYVGDGTWDSQRNTFLLPNLQGLNFDTMRYNGMGNRFRNMINYKTYVTAHAVLASLTFLLVVPAAIFMARFYHRNPRTALRFHIWLQILTVLLSTAAFILGFQAVGLERSLTNPHHGIGVTLYTLVLFQAISGSVIHRWEKNKERFKIPLKLMWTNWKHEEPTKQRPRSRRRSRSRSRSKRHGSRQEVLSSRHDSRSRVESQFTDSYLSDEKYAGNRKKTGTWRDRLLGAGAAAGGIFAIRSLFNRDKKRHAPTETGSDVSYDRPLGRSEVTQTDLSRLEEGRAPESPANVRDDWRRVEEREAAQAAAMNASPLRQGHRPGRSVTSVDSFDSRTSFSDDIDSRLPRRSYGLKEGIATLGVIGFLKHSLGKRKIRKEDAHAEAIRQHDLEEERIARANSGRRKYTGDGAPPRRNRPLSTDYSESDLTGVTPSLARPDIPRPPPMDSTVGPSTAPIRPPPHDILSESGSEAYNSPSGRSHRRHHNASSVTGPALAAGAAAAAVSTGSPSRRDHSQRRSSREGSVASPPVSVKVKMHNDGRHVTLRRLNEEEAAAEREARRKERQRRNRNGSRSSLSDLNNDRWRRNEAIEAQQAAEMGQTSVPPPPPPPAGAPLRMPEPTIPPPPPGPPPGNYGSGPGQIPLPPPPPIPAAANSVLSSPHGTQVYGTETDVSAYDSNRRRRRAERAQAKAARSGGSRVEFS
ncbi:hypothetical protein EK21DRAFT_56821 [Setomelanomma holmii]|uniref:Cytochrome b561 domain-containing protein n=1 Tax=Setomelanomma holmii TaxID=210430 RepID=A0A9P4HHH8_9PLEO|nr:hypothetical protein EK21DRAFT_56821 [Setomelanomma holmii]